MVKGIFAHFFIASMVIYDSSETLTNTESPIRRITKMMEKQHSFVIVKVATE